MLCWTTKVNYIFSIVIIDILFKLDYITAKEMINFAFEEIINGNV